MNFELFINKMESSSDCFFSNDALSQIYSDYRNEDDIDVQKIIDQYDEFSSYDSLFSEYSDILNEHELYQCDGNPELFIEILSVDYAVTELKNGHWLINRGW